VVAEQLAGGEPVFQITAFGPAVLDPQQVRGVLDFRLGGLRQGKYRRESVRFHKREFCCRGTLAPIRDACCAALATRCAFLVFECAKPGARTRRSEPFRATPIADERVSSSISSMACSQRLRVEWREEGVTMTDAYSATILLAPQRVPV
jgi:hypothetical protein